MKTSEVSLLEWQKRYGTEKACAATLVKYRWPNGFICPECGHDHAYYLKKRKLYECGHCHYQVSVTADTIFHSTNLPLVKWFWAIYLVASDKGGISATRLAKHIDVSWITARRMLHKIRTAMGDRDSIYRLQNLVEMDDALIGGKRSGGKRGRGSPGKMPVLVSVESKGKNAGFMAIQVVKTISSDSVNLFIERHIKPGQVVRTDALPALNVVQDSQVHLKKVTPASEAANWLPWVHMVIGNLKTFLNGTYHGVSSRFLQEYLDEFCYRFNRRFWEFELPYRLLNACVSHLPLKIEPENC
jgi:transposase-like protein